MLSGWTLTYMSCDSFVEDPDQEVMEEHLQDPVIKHTYDNLPWVGLVLSPITYVASSLIWWLIEPRNSSPGKRTPGLKILLRLASGNLSFAHIMRSKS
jgi:hypothetical protein